MRTQESGLPLELSVKMQINMAMREVSHMAHVEQFSNLVVPMLWFEIVSIYNRFQFDASLLCISSNIRYIAIFGVIK